MKEERNWDRKKGRVKNPQEFFEGNNRKEGMSEKEDQE